MIYFDALARFQAHASKCVALTRRARQALKKMNDARFRCGQIACTPCVKTEEDCGHCIAMNALQSWNIVSDLKSISSQKGTP